MVIVVICRVIEIFGIAEQREVSKEVSIVMGIFETCRFDAIFGIVE
jgi:hypothetical protein